MTRMHSVFLWMTLFIGACQGTSPQPSSPEALQVTEIHHPSVTATRTPTSTPEPTSTVSPTPKPATIFGCTYKECEELFSNWMDASFHHIYNIGHSRIYEASSVDLGIIAHLYETEGMLGSISLTVIDEPFYSKEQAEFLAKVFGYFGNAEVNDWFIENWPLSTEREVGFIEIEGRTALLVTYLSGSGVAFVLEMADEEYLP